MSPKDRGTIAQAQDLAVGLMESLQAVALHDLGLYLATLLSIEDIIRFQIERLPTDLKLHSERVRARFTEHREAYISKLPPIDG